MNYLVVNHLEVKTEEKITSPTFKELVKEYETLLKNSPVEDSIIIEEASTLIEKLNNHEYLITQNLDQYLDLVNRGNFPEQAMGKIHSSYSVQITKIGNMIITLRFLCDCHQSKDQFNKNTISQYVFSENTIRNDLTTIILRIERIPRVKESDLEEYMLSIEDYIIDTRRVVYLQGLNLITLHHANIHSELERELNNRLFFLGQVMRGLNLIQQNLPTQSIIESFGTDNVMATLEEGIGLLIRSVSTNIEA